MVSINEFLINNNFTDCATWWSERRQIKSWFWINWILNHRTSETKNLLEQRSYFMTLPASFSLPLEIMGLNTAYRRCMYMPTTHNVLDGIIHCGPRVLESLMVKDASESGQCYQILLIQEIVENLANSANKRVNLVLKLKGKVSKSFRRTSRKEGMVWFGNMNAL